MTKPGAHKPVILTVARWPRGLELDLEKSPHYSHCTTFLFFFPRRPPTAGRKQYNKVSMNPTFQEVSKFGA